MRLVGIIVVSLVVLGLIMAGVLVKVRAKFSGAGGETAVRVEPVGRGELVETVSAPGRVEPKTKVSISARVAAHIVELPFKEGETVTKGTTTQPASLLVKLDSKELEADLRAAEAQSLARVSQIEVSKARLSASDAQISESKVLLADAERDLGRQRELLRSKDVSQSAVDTAETKVAQIKAQLEAAERNLVADRENLVVMQHEREAAEAEIARARDNLSYTTMTSPIDGVVTRLNAEVGELVVTGTMNNPGTIIMEVADLSVMLVKARVDEGDIAKVKVGQTAKVRIQAFPDEVFDGKVQAVALAETEEKDGSKYYKTEIVLDTKGRQIPSGLTADVEVQTVRHEGVLKVPSQAVVGRPVDELPAEVRSRPEVDKNKTMATVVYAFGEGGKARAVPVKIGPSDISDTILESGVKEGEKVVVGPYKVLATLKDDTRLKEEAATTRPSTTKPTTTQSVTGKTLATR